MSTTDRTALVEFQQKAVRLQRAVSGATQAANALRPRLTAIKRAIARHRHCRSVLQDDATALEKRNNEILRALSGDTAARQRNMNTPPSINDRVGYVRERATHVDVASDADSAQSVQRRRAGLRNGAGPVAPVDRSRSVATGETTGGGGRTLDTRPHSGVAKSVKNTA